MKAQVCDCIFIFRIHCIKQSHLSVLIHTTLSLITGFTAYERTVREGGIRLTRLVRNSVINFCAEMLYFVGKFKMPVHLCIK